ncbi:MAG: STAS/SEC14 domain-containing protein [Chromatiales bacterium]|nr:MAG: STAS/SEC14 domain-containing protein [Chromatiales bacterium]
MIEVMDDFPDSVLAVRARDRVTAEDYRDVLTPAVEDKLSRHPKLRLLYHLGPDFTRFTTTALWDDARLGFHHLRDFERIALVTDVGWIGKLARTAGRAPGIDISVFPNAEIEAASAWIRDGLG